MTSIPPALNHMHPGISDEPIVRALLYNLVIVCNSTANEAYYTETATQIASAIPGRIIMILPESTETLPDSRIFCSIATDGKRTFCGEVVTVSINIDLPELPRQILPLIAPDIPVYIWKDDTTGDAIELDWLDAIADTQIVNGYDSDTKISSFINNVDLTWLRLECWMKAITRIFDDMDILNQINELDEISITIGQNSPSYRIADPILLTAWIASCLDSEAQLKNGNEHKQLLMHLNNRPITLKCECFVESNTRPSVKAVTFRFSGQRETQEIIIKQMSDKLHITSDPKSVLEHMLPESTAPDGILLAREIGDESMQHRYNVTTEFAFHKKLII